MKSDKLCNKGYRGILLVLFVIFGGILAFSFENLAKISTDPMHVYSSVSFFKEGCNGRSYVSDGQKKMLLVLDKDGNIKKNYDGGSLKEMFYYATHVCDDENGNIYLSDIVYGERGNRIQKERIIKLTSSGREILWEIDYPDDETAPLQYGQILQLDYVKGQICALFYVDDHLSFQALNLSQNGRKRRVSWSVMKEWKINGRIESAQYDADQGILAFSLRTGEIYYCRDEEGKLRKIPAHHKDPLPRSVDVGENEIFYSDVDSLGLYRVNLDSLETEVLSEGDYMFHYISYAKTSKRLLMTDFESCYIMDQTGKIQQIRSSRILRFPYFVIRWIILVLMLIYEIVILMAIILYLIRRVMASDKKEYIMRFVMVLFASILVGSIMSWSEIREMKESQLDSQLNSLELFAQTIALNIDGDDIRKLSKPSAYGSETYYKVRKPLDAIINESYKAGQPYYYCIYAPSADGVFVDGIMDYEDSITISTPSDLFAGDEYRRVLIEGKNYRERDDRTAYGAWMYVDVPIRNKNGEICGFMETGTNLDMFNEETRKLIFENLCSAFCNAAVVAMMFLEILFLISFYEYKKKKELALEYQKISVPIRAVNFLTYAATGLIDAFIIIMCTNLFKQDGAFLSQIMPAGIGAALPLSAELLLSSLSSLFGGVLSERFGSQKMIRIGFLIQFSGFLSCFLKQNYLGILIGLSLIGLGMGLVYVASNTMAAKAGNEQSREKGFADVAAGGMSGAAVGVGLGSLILSIGNYRTVFAVGAVLMIFGILLCIGKNEDIEESVSEIETEEESRLGFKESFRFLFNRRVFVFFVFLVTPFMMSLSYKDYFFPMYAENMGINEVQIGQIQLVCGMLVLYIGPYLSHLFIESIGGARSLILSMVSVVAGLGIYLISPSLITAIIAMLFLYVAHSFGYTCQYYYFDQLPAVSAYGEGGAMGIFSMFENIGQTMGPILFGAALISGFWEGILTVAGVLIFCLIAFVFVGLKKERSADK